MQQEEVVDFPQDDASEMAARIVTEDWLVRAPVFYIEALKADVLYTKGGVTLDAATALQSGNLVTNLMKLGVVSMNLVSAMQSLNGTAEMDADLVPAFLVGMSANFATNVASRRVETDVGEAICLDRLASDIARIERQLGPIPVDHALCTDIAALAVAIREGDISLDSLMTPDQLPGGEA